MQIDPPDPLEAAEECSRLQDVIHDLQTEVKALKAAIFQNERTIAYLANRVGVYKNEAAGWRKYAERKKTKREGG